MIAWNKNTIDNYVDSDSYSGDRIVMTIMSSTIPRVDIPTTVITMSMMEIRYVGLNIYKSNKKGKSNII